MHSLLSRIGYTLYYMMVCKVRASWTSLTLLKVNGILHWWSTAGSAALYMLHKCQYKAGMVCSAVNLRVERIAKNVHFSSPPPSPILPTALGTFRAGGFFPLPLSLRHECGSRYILYSIFYLLTGCTGIQYILSSYWLHWYTVTNPKN